MYEVNQVLFDKRTVSSAFSATHHVIDQKVKVVDSDGNTQYLYHLTGYGVYYSEQNLIDNFMMLVVEDEAQS